MNISSQQHQQVHNTIALAGQEYQLYYDFNALCIIEQYSEHSIQEVHKILNSLTGLRILLFAGLQKYHQDVFTDINYLNELIDIQDISTYIQIMSQVLSECLGNATDSKKKVH